MQDKENKKEGTIRPPVVTVVGHIDHGKSTLLDEIRKENSVESEAGGITQHISAYEVDYKTKKSERHKITFLDTPGHEAFHSERVRGIDIADIAILIVAADDGVKEQTKESIKALKENSVPFVVAINKIDKEDASVERVKQELAENDVFVEGYGGQVSYIAVSAKEGKGIPELLEIILLTAKVEEFKGEKNKNAEGIVLESNIDAQKGVSATLIIKDGSLKKGMFVVAGEAVAPIRIMEDFKGEAIDEAGPSKPVKIVGFKDLPKTGACFETFEKKKEAENAMSSGGNEESECKTEIKKVGIQEEKMVIPFVIKADVAGSIEAIEHEFEKISIEGLEIKIIQKSLGEITENDIHSLLGMNNAFLIGFGVKANSRAIEMARKGGVNFECFDIIYELIDWTKEELLKLKPKKEVEETTGFLKVKRVFTKSKDVQVIGGVVKEGELLKKSKIKILRRGDEIGKGVIVNLQKQKTDTEKVAAPNECGIQAQSKIEIAEGDILEGFKKVKK